MRSLEVGTIVIVLLAGGFAGCLDEKVPPSEAPPETQPTGGTTATEPDTPGPPIEQQPNIPLEAFFSSCREWGNLVAGPVDVFSGPLPQGWSRGTLPVASLLMHFLECNRISWGRFERGPVHILMEFTEDMDPPESCREGDIARTHMLRAFWIDDAEIASWLKASYGIPSVPGVFEVSIAADGLEEAWAFSDGSGSTSEMHFQDLPSTLDASVPYTHRMYWFNESSLSYIDLAEQGRQVDDLASPTAFGILQPPTQYAMLTGQSAYYGGVDYAIGVEAQASIYHFGDTECKVPAPF